MSITISMLIGSLLSSRFLVQKSISTILNNIGTSDYLLVIGITKRVHPKIIHMVKNNLSARIILETEHTDSYAEFTNYVFSKYATHSKWFLVVHDDVELKTENFLSTVEKILKPLQTDIGWISFTDDDYLNGHWGPSTRPGYHLDFLTKNAWDRRKMFQFHTLQEGWIDKGNYENLNYDFPLSPVICHAPFSHFIMIESEKYKPCENWSKISLLVDEDWGLEAMKEGLFNIWIPNVIYRHCRILGTRANLTNSIKGCYKVVHKSFRQKWGFAHSPLKRDVKKNKVSKSKILEKIKRRYGRTNIVWSIDRNSFDWDYVI